MSQLKIFLALGFYFVNWINTSFSHLNTSYDYSESVKNKAEIISNGNKIEKKCLSDDIRFIRKRKISVEEYHFALSLFPREFPTRDEITITDGVSPANGAYYVRPTVGSLIGEGNIQMHMGQYFDDCLKDKSLFAHELTHVWQIRHFGVDWYLKEFAANHIFCSGDSYSVNCSEKEKLGNYNAEQQGVLVSRYYSKSDSCAVNVVKRALETDTWRLMIGSSGLDLSISSQGNIYLINNIGNIYTYSGIEWTRLPGSDGVSIAANSGRVLLVNKIGNIYEWKDGSWVKLSGSSAIDITVSSNGEIWMVNNRGKIYKLNSNTWKQMPGSSAKRISSDGGQTWMTNSAGKIYKYNYQDNKWQQVAGSGARDITVSNTGDIFITNSIGNIYQFTDNSFTKLDGSNGLSLSANNGKLLLINTEGRIFKRSF